MLRGRYDGKISTKFQIALPKKFREELGDRIIVTKGLGKRLMIVSEKKWETLLEGTTDSPFIHKDASDLQRFVLGNAYDAELDSKGRCVLPAYLRNYAEITEDIVFGGMNHYIEMWDRKNWEEEQERLSKNIPEIAQRLTNSAQERVET